MVYSLSVRLPDLSDRSLKLKSSITTMSLPVLPSPISLSGSLLVMETRVTTGSGSQMSVACVVGTMVTSLWFGGQRPLGDALKLRVGGVVSTMVTFWVSVSLLPLSSVAVQTTTVLPSGNRAGALLLMSGLVSQLSSAVAVPSTTGVAFCDEHSVTKSAGTVMFGASVSRTVTVNSVLLVSPAISSAVHHTSVLPPGNRLPDL